MVADPRAPLAPRSRALASHQPAFLTVCTSRWVRPWLLALLALLAVLAGSGGASATPASAHSFSFKVLGGHGLAAPQAQPAATTPTGPLVNHGGPVQDHPRVYLVFWGPSWNQDTDGVRLALMHLFDSLAGGNYNNILSQYTGNRGAPANYLHTDSVLAGWTIDARPLPGSLLDNWFIGEEALLALQNNGWANTANTQVLVFPQQGAQYSGVFNSDCGYHFFGTTNDVPPLPANVVAGWVRYSSDWNCNWSPYNTVADNMTKVAVHEYAEMATDPEPNANPAWQGASGGDAEIGDLCNNDTFTYLPANISTYHIFVQTLWSNQDNQCEQAVGQEFVYSGPPGKHTVQGSILNVYASFGGPGGRLGSPVSEEYPNAAGYHESDFQGGNIQVVNGRTVVQAYPSCVTPAAIYAPHVNGDLLWYGNADPTGGSWSWASGTGNLVGTGWEGAFSGGNGIIYSIHRDGTLWWYKHLGAANGSWSWAPGSGSLVGSGWFFSYVFSGGNGIIYAVTNAGNLLWYDHLGYLNGSWSWASGSGNLVGTGWGYDPNGISYVFPGGNGVIYAVHTDGTLWWYKHLGAANGSWSWAPGSGLQIGSGWAAVNGTLDAFSAGGGIIFRIGADYNLYWYDHLGFLDGSGSWANGGNGKFIGSGWGGLSGPFADVDACK